LNGASDFATAHRVTQKYPQNAVEYYS